MLFALVLLFKIVLTFIILWIKMSIFKNLIFLPLDLITIFPCLPDFPWWLELIYFHLLIANAISLTFLYETLQRIFLTVLNSFPPFRQLYAQWGIVRGYREFSRWYINPDSSRRNKTPCSLPHFQNYIYCNVYSIDSIYFTLVGFTPFKIYTVPVVKLK